MVFAAQPVKQLQNPFACLVVEGAGWLVAEQELRILCQGACNGDALLLAAGKLCGKMSAPVFQTDEGERRRRVDRVFAELGGDFDVFERREIRDQVVELEDKPDVMPAVVDQPAVIERRDFRTIHKDTSRRDGVHPAKQVEQGCFPGTGGSQQHAEFALLHAERDVIQRPDRDFTCPVQLRYMIKFDIRHDTHPAFLFLFCIHYITKSYTFCAGEH